MPIKAILFDLDGTLLPMDQDIFVKEYFSGMASHMASHGYEPKKLIDAIGLGSVAMIKNDGVLTNEEVFWNMLRGIYGDGVTDDIPLFDEFYRTKFDKIGGIFEKDPSAIKAVATLKKKGYRLILATNPLFPMIATYARIRMAGLSAGDFEYVSTYENSRSCKPSLSYYREILEKTGLEATDCIMVGNDVGDDMVASALGMNVFLLTNCLINKNGEDISVYPNGSFDELLKYIKNQAL